MDAHVKQQVVMNFTNYFITNKCQENIIFVNQHLRKKPAICNLQQKTNCLSMIPCMSEVMFF